MRLYKQLGDRCLYIAGLFQESLNHRGISTSYYVGMGESAYTSVAVLLHKQMTSNSHLYEELADLFPQLVQALDFMKRHEALSQKQTPGLLH